MKRTLKEDPAYYPVDRGNNDDDESSNDDDDDDDVEKDEEDKEEEEHLAPADLSDVSTDYLGIKDLRDVGGGGLVLLGGKSSKEVKKGRGLNGDQLGGVEKIRALGTKGEDSFDEMSITSVLGIFLGGFLVEEFALEVNEIVIKKKVGDGFL
uniref:Uncharacterized protein n=1 Tax=Tanacetum cinerariifolium TaxID=118510 RepID=A0A699ICN6_TANCI|nr:hypothetical protein [Tanacetum cinerariifolium]